MAELNNAQPSFELVLVCYDPMPSNRHEPVRQSFKHDAGVDDYMPIRRCSVNPLVFDLDLKTPCGSARKGSNQVDISMFLCPYVPAVTAAGGFTHRRVLNCSSQVRAMLKHCVEIVFICANTSGNDSQETSLQFNQTLVEMSQDFCSVRYMSRWEDWVTVAMGITLS